MVCGRQIETTDFDSPLDLPVGVAGGVVFLVLGDFLFVILILFLGGDGLCSTLLPPSEDGDSPLDFFDSATELWKLPSEHAEGVEHLFKNFHSVKTSETVRDFA